MLAEHELAAEWLETDAFGGYASGTVGGLRTRRYHALLLSALTPPGRRVVLVNGVEAWLTTRKGRFPLSSHLYVGEVSYPKGHQHISGFSLDPWPTWTFRLAPGLVVSFEIVVARDSAQTLLRWKAVEGDGLLEVRPLMSGRNFHDLHLANREFNFSPIFAGNNVAFRPYAGLPTVNFSSNGVYAHTPEWYRSFLYPAERERGLPCVEDLAAPGTFSFDLETEPALLLLQTGVAPKEGIQTCCAGILATERARRSARGTPLERSAEAYLSHRGTGKTLLAGFPWFGDWGRDTFVALRGFAIASGRLQEAEAILTLWAAQMKDGLIPNCFSDENDPPGYNSVDASLWFIVAAQEFLEACSVREFTLNPRTQSLLVQAILTVLENYWNGTRYSIRADLDGLLICGEIEGGVQGTQLTWMDVKIEGQPVTPRIGKPVEVEALWINALRIGAGHRPVWQERFELALRSFRIRFWSEETGSLFDVVDVDHQPGRVDRRFRPNQIFAVGGLPYALLPPAKAARLVAAVEAELLTPLGLRSLSPHDPAYQPHYTGGIRERDTAYHMGTVWPWLMGPFVEAWLRVHGDRPGVRDLAFERFLTPLLRHLSEAGLGHLSELADGAPPHTPRGAPFQAWSLGELLRLLRLLGREPPEQAIRFGAPDRRSRE